MMRMYLRFADLSLLEATQKEIQLQIALLAKEQDSSHDQELLEDARVKARAE